MEIRKFDNFINKEKKITIFPNIGIQKFRLQKING